MVNVIARFSRKYQLRKDDWVGLEAVITLAVSEAEAAQLEPHEVIAEAFAIAKAGVLAQRNELRREIQEAKAHAAAQHTVALDTDQLALAPPHTSDEAAQRFFARYGQLIGGTTWNAAQHYLGRRIPRPTTIEGWYAAAEAVRDQERAATASASHNGTAQP